MYAADGAGALHALDRATGRQLWRTTITSGVIRGMNLVLSNGVVVVPERDTTYGVDATTGAVVWRYAAPPDVGEDPFHPAPGYVGFTRIATDGPTVFISAWGASISALDVRTGVPRWTWQTVDSNGFRSGTSGVRLSGDTVYAVGWHWLNELGGVAEQWLLALDRSTGRELWRKTFPPHTHSVSVEGAPVIVGDLVVFQCSRRLYVVAKDEVLCFKER